MIRPGEFVKLTIIEPSLRPHWPREVSSLDHFCTTVFDRALMLSWIEFGWTDAGFTLILGTWLCITPKCYRQRAGEIAVEVFERSFKNDVYRPHTAERYVDELRDALWEKLEPIVPGHGP